MGLADERHPREIALTGFSSALGRCLDEIHGALAVVFIDAEGEFIDFESRVDPFEAKVIAAEAVIAVQRAAQGLSSVGSVDRLELDAPAGRVFVGRVSDQYWLVALVAFSAREEAAKALGRCIEALRAECGVDRGAWRVGAVPVAVETRPAKRWACAPRVLRVADRDVEVAEVLGRWLDAANGLTCFRVRIEGEGERTVGQETSSNRWWLLD